MLKLSWPASSLLLYQHDALDRISTLAISGSALVQRFYDDQYLRTETRAMRGTSYFRQGNQVLALHETESTRLLALDSHASSLIGLDAGQLRSRAYSPYGHSPLDNDSLAGFNGEPIERETGHYLLGKGYRAYSSAMMRFTRPDSASPFGQGGLNSFAYVLGDPINHTDPSGRFALRAIAKLFWRPGLGRRAKQFVAEGTGLGEVPHKQLKQLVQSPRFRPQGRPGPLPALPRHARFHPHFPFSQASGGAQYPIYEAAMVAAIPRRVFGTSIILRHRPAPPHRRFDATAFRPGVLKAPTKQFKILEDDAVKDASRIRFGKFERWDYPPESDY
ncbi:hypothetical protein DCO48_03910 [Pseudomonas sp. SDI]|uniref:RHS repeat-associated core domain-containing protein n=1 Tax=Pseudomonas sp. SDI TaxID=2170734 RepID=UPI000DE61CD8|nr:RHS repeat-associated core domain-containing protein [Pseudomonas sp. SDI]PWB35138.1 hypothetical protein DCO48_03910 [Pseudomonas sp. SDI]